MKLDDFPKNELEFHERFSDEEKCREYWVKIRWPNGFVCAHCGHHGGWRRKGREEWVCARRSCGKETSMRAGTVLHKSPKPLRAWLLAMFHMSVNKQGISALRLQRLMGFGCYETALRWLRELRRIMAPPEDAGMLGPEVEVDEKALGGVEKGGKGPFVGKTWIIGAVERKGQGCGRARLRVIGSDRSQPTLCGFVKEFVEPNSIVYTDAAAGYIPLASMGYVHSYEKTTNGRGSQLKLEDGREKAAIHLPQIHKVFSLVERIVLGAFQGSFSERHLQSYLDEYCFRFNRRKTNAPLGIFQELVGRAVRSQCVPLWRSRGRIAPDVPTRKRTCEWLNLGSFLEGCVYVG
jgi:transposase-like protein